jgi:hypothetical protein
MSFPTSTIAYTDCYEAFDRALDHPRGIKVPTRTSADAERLRMRMHQARKLAREANTKIYPDPEHPLHGRSPYDALVVRIDGNWVRVEPIQSFADKIVPIDDEEDDEVEVAVRTLPLIQKPFRRRV